MTVRAATDDPSANEVVGVTNRSGAGQFLIVCEHASKFIPAGFGNLGLDHAALNSHIAWDPGALAVAEAMSALLDAPLVAQRVSRLLYDCNRPPEAESAVPSLSEVTQVPGNTGLSAADREARVARFYVPFRDTLAGCLDRRIKSRPASAAASRPGARPRSSRFIPSRPSTRGSGARPGSASSTTPTPGSPTRCSRPRRPGWIWSSTATNLTALRTA